jgi:hypothetical protein
VDYACYRTYFRTITVYSIASYDFSTHIHHGGEQFFGRIKKFSKRPGTISLREFKATFSTVVCELEFKYGANYIEAFAFKQLARYVHYEALDVYEQHSARILGVTQIPNPTYAIAIATTSQAALQAAIAHHGTLLNNPDLSKPFSSTTHCCYCKLSRPQVPYGPTRGSKYAAMRKRLELGARS